MYGDTAISYISSSECTPSYLYKIITFMSASAAPAVPQRFPPQAPTVVAAQTPVTLGNAYAHRNCLLLYCYAMQLDLLIPRSNFE